MTAAFDTEIHINKIFLDHENARHDPVNGEDDAIEALCANEPILEMAKDIAVNGLNPMDRIGVLALDETTDGKDVSYIALEGNRRMCAIKLLFDPDRAPASQRAAFKKASETWTGMAEISVVVFPTRENADLWLERFHMGENKGLGRRPWKPEMQARKFGLKKNQVAIEVLNYCEQEGFIATAERKNKVTTLQRVLANQQVKDVLGISVADDKTVYRNRNKTNFHKNLKKLMTDLITGKLNSRMNKAKLNTYAKNFKKTVGSQKTSQATPINTSASPGSKSSNNTGGTPNPKITKDDKIHDLLNDAGVDKLIWLYRSLHQVNIGKHTPLVAVGCWSFFETLTKNAGRKDSTNFVAFCSKQQLKKYKLDKSYSTINAALKRISNGGNSTKHDEEAAVFDAKQLANDMKTLNRLTIALLKKIIEDK